MEIKLYKTHEISDETWGQIADGFNQSFAGHTITKDKLIAININNEFGYSYHAIGFDGDKVMAFNTIHPFRYHSKTGIVNVGLSGSTFTLKEYRKDIFIFSDLYKALVDQCKTDGYVYFLGVPNENSYQYSIKLLGCKENGKLPFYILPVKVSKILNKHSLSWVNIFSLSFSYIWVLLSLIISFIIRSKEVQKMNRAVITDKFLDNRFPSPKYTTIKNGSERYSYTIANEDGCKCAYLMDFRNGELKNSFTLAKALWHILIHDSVDAIMYVGTMNLCQMSLIKAPHKFDPKPLRLTYRLLEKPKKDPDLQDFNNWDFSLLNLDVR